MGQYWTLLNLDKSERHNDWGKLGEFLFGAYPTILYFHLLQPIVEISSEDEEGLAAHMHNGINSSSFPELAAEIVAHIFDEIDDALDCFSLALTSQRCWLIGQGRIKAVVLENVVNWAGDRIICVGDYLRHGDVPEGILTAEEEEQEEVNNRKPADIKEPGLISLTDYILSGGSYDLKSALSNIIWSSLTHLSVPDQRKLVSSIKINHRKPEILRNISRHQYVHRSALREMRSVCPAHCNFGHVNFGHVVLSRICWSTDPSVSTPYEGDIHRGVWAGDRFDITSMDALDELDENGQRVEWTDVSEEVMEEMRLIWSSEFGLNRWYVQTLIIAVAVYNARLFSETLRGVINVVSENYVSYIGHGVAFN